MMLSLFAFKIGFRYGCCDGDEAIAADRIDCLVII
jgi:hypothetical protein